MRPPLGSDVILPGATFALGERDSQLTCRLS